MAIIPAPPGPAPEGYYWHPVLGRYVPNNFRRPGQDPGDPPHSGNPDDYAVPRTTPPATTEPFIRPSDRVAPRPVTSYMPQTIYDMIARFYTPDFGSFLQTGELGKGIPQPEGSLLGLLNNSLFQQRINQYGIAPLQQWQTAGQFGQVSAEPPPIRPASVLGLQGGAAAYGFIDPSWMNDVRSRTQMVPVTTMQLLAPKKKKPAAAAAPAPWVPPRQYPTPNHPNNPNSPNWNPGWKDM